MNPVKDRLTGTGNTIPCIPGYRDWQPNSPLTHTDCDRQKFLPYYTMHSYRVVGGVLHSIISRSGHPR